MPVSAKEQKLEEDMILYNSVRKTGGYWEKIKTTKRKKALHSVIILFFYSPNALTT